MIFGLVLLVVLLLQVVLGTRMFVIVGSLTGLCLLLYLEYTNDPFTQLSIIVIKMESLIQKPEFLSIPLFVAAGTIMSRGGIAERLTEFARALVGWVPGGVATAAVVSCIIFAAISGSSPVTLVAVGSVMYPALVGSGYSQRFTIGLLASAGSLGCMIPPAIAMLVYAISVQGSAVVDPTDLFIAGALPALFIAGCLIVYCIIVGIVTKGSREPFDPARLLRAARRAGWSLLLPLVVLGGIYGGIFFPTEAGAVALVASIVISVFIHADIPMRRLPSLLSESGTLIGSLILVVVLSFGLNHFLFEADAAGVIKGWVSAANMNSWQFMIFVNAVLIVLGALMDSLSATLVFAPILAPVAVQKYGFDPYHFGVVFTVNMEIGYLAPPVATNLFVAAAIFRQPFGNVVRAIFPTLGIICAALVIVIFVPTMSLLPLNLRDGKAAYSPFPWDGAPPPAVEQPVQPPQDGTQPEEVKTKKKPKSLEELRKAALEKLEKEKAAQETPPTETPAPEPGSP